MVYHKVSDRCTASQECVSWYKSTCSRIGMNRQWSFWFLLWMLGCEASIIYICVCGDIMLSILEFAELCFVWTVLRVAALKRVCSVLILSAWIGHLRNLLRLPLELCKTVKLNSSMEQNLFSETNLCSSQEILHVLWNWKVYYYVHNILPRVSSRAKWIHSTFFHSLKTAL